MNIGYSRVRLKISRFLLLSAAFLITAVSARAEMSGSHAGTRPSEVKTTEFSKGTAELAGFAGSFAFIQMQAPALSGNDMGEQLSVDKKSLLQTLAIVSIVLIVIIVLMMFIIANLSNLIRIREGKEPMTFRSTVNKTIEMLMNPYINAVAMLTGAIIGLFIIVPIARGVGHHEGYQPTQPIKFSHKIHAGDWKIDCQYCHAGASRGKYATIPSTNVCMNCHKAITKGARWGETEINKIQASMDNNKPIEWTRIHNLPDLAYFNHSQHVVVGKVACTKCHGPVAEMDYPMYQYNRLSMGFCISCHRETTVDAELYKTLGYEAKDPKHKPLVVADIGGIECVRCHY
jgi:Cytochrome c7 and related cytochrome c/Class III cytochrome C family